MSEKREPTREELLKKMSKNKSSAGRGLNDLKSNVELGKELDLYILNEVVGQGLPLLTPKGATIKREIERFVLDEELRRGYLHTSTPIMAKADLYKISGHWQHYKDSMFSMDIRGDTYALRPMTCPFHFVLYKRKSRTYKEMPIRYAEISPLFRNEKSGELRGLTRLRQFTLADAHLICRPDQIEEEFKGVLELVKFLMKKLGITDTWYRFSKWDSNNKEKYIDNPKAWESSQKMMKKILDGLKLKYVEAEDEAAFYGPKLDLQYKDVYGKEDTLITIQIDFALPELFDLSYINKEGKPERPMVIHRSSAGATERVMAYIIEKTQGKLPLWLSHTQVKVLSINETSAKYAEEISNKLRDNNVRVILDNNNDSIGKKIKNSIKEKVSYTIVVGDNEVKNKVVSVRNRDGETENDVKIADFVKKVTKEIEDKV